MGKKSILNPEANSSEHSPVLLCPAFLFLCQRKYAVAVICGSDVGAEADTYRFMCNIQCSSGWRDVISRAASLLHCTRTQHSIRNTWTRSGSYLISQSWVISIKHNITSALGHATSTVSMWKRCSQWSVWITGVRQEIHCLGAWSYLHTCDHGRDWNIYIFLLLWWVSEVSYIKTRFHCQSHTIMLKCI